MNQKELKDIKQLETNHQVAMRVAGSNLFVYGSNEAIKMLQDNIFDMMKTQECYNKRIAELESALQVEKSAHEETKYVDAETSNQAFSWIAKQRAALKKLGQAKRARDKALIEEIKQLREQLAAKDEEIKRLQAANHAFDQRAEVVSTRLKEYVIKSSDRFSKIYDIAEHWINQHEKAEKLLANWQQTAIEERCKSIMLIEKLKDVTNNSDWQTKGLSKTYDEYMQQAAKELNL